MQADFSVELGGDSPALEIPWCSDDPNVRYLDLKKHPELVQQISEAVLYPELGSFLARINTPGFPLATAKCDAWASSELDPEDEIFGDRKFVSYVDLIFVDEKDRCSFAKHEAFAKQLCRLLSHTPEIAATVELVIRHCYWHEGNSVSHDGPPAEESPVSSDCSSSENRSAFQDGSAPKESAGSKNSSEQSGAGPSGTEKDPGMMPPVNALTINHRAETDFPLHDRVNHRVQIDVATHDTHGDIAEWADVAFDGQPIRIPFHDQYTGVQYANFVPSAQCADLTAHHEYKREFCMTAYVTGFGDSDHDPLRQWAIGVNLLLHAIIQLNSNSQPKP
jgi:hypothetical protein